MLRKMTFNGPHIVVTTQGPKAVKGEVNWAGDLCALRGGTSADNARALKWKEAQAEDLILSEDRPALLRRHLPRQRRQGDGRKREGNPSQNV